MYINADLSTDTAANLLRSRAEAGTTASQPTASSGNGAAASPLDPSLQRLTDVPSDVQDAQWELHDEAGANQAIEAARQSMLRQPGTVLAAQANQLPQNVLSLLQPTD